MAGYTHDRELGAGASGRVILARHDNTGTPVAIKYLAREIRSDRDFRAEFRAEARLLGDLRSPHVARLYEYVESDEGAAIVMELVDGVALRELLRHEGAASPEAALVVLKGSLLGLASAHRAGVVHRDYKPENVLVTADGCSKLVDFGIAARSGASVDIAGTPAYMAPEHWEGRPPTPTTDVYAATATFFECLTGTKPYTGSTLVELAVQHTQAPIPAEMVPEPLRPLILSGLAKTPQQRPASAADFVEQLEAVAAAYGEDWEERGRFKLAALVTLLPLLLPSTGANDSGTTALSTTSLERADVPGSQPAEPWPESALAKQRLSPRRRRISSHQGKVLMGTAAALLAGGVIVTWPDAGNHSAPSAARSPTANPSDGSIQPTANPGGVFPSDGSIQGSTSSGTAAEDPPPSTSSPSASGLPAISSSPAAATSTPALPLPSAPSHTPTSSAPSHSPRLDVYSVSVSKPQQGQGCSIQTQVTVRTNGAAEGILTLSWFHTNSAAGTRSVTVATEQIRLPKGQMQVSDTYSHAFSIPDHYAYQGVRASTSPSADSGNNSFSLVEASPSCDPPR
ncbi:protein kinase domain-containing protein [Streptomyces sp. CA-251387]|uniref:serine/threonine-protein kinase n=1 Tax=Streptomyces sp. CA-251387 TaxID=3240064 RepID=UPI003D8F807D